MPSYIAQPQPVSGEQARALRPDRMRRVRDVSASKLVIGWREWLAMPELGIPAIKAKIDTGARTSALHTHDYHVFQRDGADWVRFQLHPLRRTDAIELECEAPVIDTREVKDSGGHVEPRPFIRAELHLSSLAWTVEISLTNRESMKFRMLLGRTALRGIFLVDSRASFVTGSQLSHAYDAQLPAPPVRGGRS